MPDRSKLGDLIVDNGPYVVGQAMPFPKAPNGHPMISAAEINGLREELIRLRRIEADVQDVLERWLDPDQVYDIRRFTDDLRAAVRGDA